MAISNPAEGENRESGNISQRPKKKAYPQHTPIQHKPLLLRQENLAVFLALHFGLKRRLVHTGVEPVSSLGGVEPL